MRNPRAFPLSRLASFLILAAVFPAPAFGQDIGPEGGSEGGPEGGSDGSPELFRLSDVQRGALLLKTSVAGVYLRAPTLDTDVAIRVTGPVARTTVTQRFLNETSFWVEGVYAFPLPENAAVDGLKMVVGERVIEGQIREREEARRTYDEAKADGKKAALLEQQRPNLFTTAVANLGPGEVVEVEIQYQQELRCEGGATRRPRFSLRFPLVAAPRYHAAPPTPTAPPVPEPPRSSRPINAVSLRVDLAAGFPLARVESPSHQLTTRRLDPSRYEVELASGVVPADRDFVLEWEPAAGAAPAGALFTEERDGETYALLLMMPPATAAGTRFDLPREVVFVIDTSGSMAGASMREARAALDLALARLAPHDSFNVIEFDSLTRRLFPASVAATPEALRQARRWVDALDADGGTEMLPALEAALDGPGESSGSPLRQVIFITDGQVDNEEQLFALIAAKLGGSRLFTVGIGSAPNAFFMTKAAELGRGTFTYIGDPGEVAEKMAALFTRLASPVLTDLAVTWNGSGAEAYPQRIPDLYLGEPVVLAAKLGSAGGPLTLSGRTLDASGRASRPWEVRLDPLGIAAPAGLDRRGGLDKLWARRKVAALTDQRLTGGDEQSLRAVIVEVGLAHGLVTEATSLVAVDTTPTAPTGEPNHMQLIPVNVPAGWEVGFAEGVLPQGGTAARMHLLIGVVLLGLGLLAWRRAAS